jgi:hypothetical protein
MNTIKQMGIWMDHSNALLMELSDENIVSHSVASEYNHQEPEPRFTLQGKLLHSKEQRTNYFKKLSEFIINFQQVVLFGPTDAKNDLLYLLKADQLFNNIRIEVKVTDKMSKDQMHSFVKEYFRS